MLRAVDGRPIGRGVARKNAAIDALPDRCEPEDRERLIEIPAFNGVRASRTPAIGADVFLFGGNAAGLEIDALQRAPTLAVGMPEEGVVSDVRDRMTDSAEFPIEHRDEFGP